MTKRWLARVGVRCGRFGLPWCHESVWSDIWETSYYVMLTSV